MWFYRISQRKHSFVKICLDIFYLYNRETEQMKSMSTWILSMGPNFEIAISLPCFCIYLFYFDNAFESNCIKECMTITEQLICFLQTQSKFEAHLHCAKTVLLYFSIYNKFKTTKLFTFSYESLVKLLLLFLSRLFLLHHMYFWNIIISHVYNVHVLLF